MKTAMLILGLWLLMGGGFAQSDSMVSEGGQPKAPSVVDEESLLDFYRQHSSFTDPGEYEYLYQLLPESLAALCGIVRSQFIHPHAELPRYREQIPRERWNEMSSYPSVLSILKGLVTYDASGLTKDRKPKDRLILGCQQSALLLTSILKHRGIPARIRAGHATYLIPNFHTSHTVCEVWNEDERRWMLVDPSTDRVDFSEAEFDFSYEAWTQWRKGEIDPNQYGVPQRYSGVVSIVGKINYDLAAILGTEYPISQYAPMLEYALKNEGRLTTEHIQTLNRICELLKKVDAESFSELQDTYNNTPEIHMTKSFHRI